VRRLTLATTLTLTTLMAASLVVAGVAAADVQTSVSAQPRFEFRLGFNTLASLIPDVAGQPVEDEHPVPGDWTIQRTTGGLMVWNGVANWTSFTDGSTTWILGPFGLEVRPNDQRFDWESDPPLTYGDSFAYCSAVGTIDRLDARYTGLPVPPAVKRGLVSVFGPGAANLPDQGVFLRCFDGELLACSVGANLNCGKADISQTPNPGMVQYCQADPDSSFIPAFITGHEGIYSWKCAAGQPAIDRQIFHVDPRGFVAEFWHEIPPPDK